MAKENLGKRTDQRVQLVYSQAVELLWHGQIETTVERPKKFARSPRRLSPWQSGHIRTPKRSPSRRPTLRTRKIGCRVYKRRPEEARCQKAHDGSSPDLQEIQGDKERRAPTKSAPRISPILSSRRSSAYTLPGTTPGPGTRAGRRTPASSVWVSDAATMPTKRYCNSSKQSKAAGRQLFSYIRLPKIQFRATIAGVSPLFIYIRAILALRPLLLTYPLIYMLILFYHFGIMEYYGTSAGCGQHKYQNRCRDRR